MRKESSFFVRVKPGLNRSQRKNSPCPGLAVVGPFRHTALHAPSFPAASGSEHMEIVVQALSNVLPGSTVKSVSAPASSALARADYLRAEPLAEIEPPCPAP